ncbi:MAG: SPOR domain-containing protein [Bacteroidetes bacterium]|nr:SPOR domain-containing protein [Bacteroidota bacterium]
MLRIDQHINSLLYFHDCVIVPGFGGFVANYAPATIHATQHYFTPPSKKIVFNINLNNNDGLLANEIAVKQGIVFSEAGKIIENCVQYYLRELALGNKIVIENVGTLFYDVEKNLQFEPSKEINHLTAAFGLSPVQSAAIRRDGHVHRIEKQFKDRIPSVSELPKRKLNIRKYVGLAILIPAVVSLIWVPYKTEMFKNINYSSLNPFANKELSLYTQRISDLSDKLTTLTTTDNNSVNSATVENSLLKLSDGVSIPVKLEQKPVVADTQIAEADTTKVVVNTISSVSGNYHVIAGCFKVLENAQKFVSQLSSKNLDAKIIGQNADGLHMVSIGDFSSKENAFAQISSARQLNQDVWLWEN